MTTVNLEQTAALLGAHPETVRLEAKAGELPGRKVGKRWMFSTGTPALTLRRSRLSVGPRSSCTRPSMETRHRTRCMGDYMTPSEPLRLPSVIRSLIPSGGVAVRYGGSGACAGCAERSAHGRHAAAVLAGSHVPSTNRNGPTAARAAKAGPARTDFAAGKAHTAQKTRGFQGCPLLSH